MQITEDTAGSLILAVNGIRTILTEEDEAALLQRLLDRAGGLQNLWTEAATAPTCPSTIVRSEYWRGSAPLADAPFIGLPMSGGGMI